MNWYTTAEAAERLGITAGRVRQLVVKHKSNPQLVKAVKGKNLISEALLRKLAPSGSKARQATEEPYSELLSLENGLHQLPDGRLIQVFTSEEYRELESALIKLKEITAQIAQERERREYLEELQRHYQQSLTTALELVKIAQGNSLQRNAIEAKEKGLYYSRKTD